MQRPYDHAALVAVFVAMGRLMGFFGSGADAGSWTPR